MPVLCRAKARCRARAQACDAITCTYLFAISLGRGAQLPLRRARRQKRRTITTDASVVRGGTSAPPCALLLGSLLTHDMAHHLQARTCPASGPVASARRAWTRWTCSWMDCPRAPRRRRARSSTRVADCSACCHPSTRPRPGLGGVAPRGRGAGFGSTFRMDIAI